MARHATKRFKRYTKVRDNIHSNDLVQCFHFYRSPKPGAVYNIGGSRFSNCSILEAIELIAELGGYKVSYSLSDSARATKRRFQQDFPLWVYTYDLRAIVTELIEAATERYRGARNMKEDCLEASPRGMASSS